MNESLNVCDPRLMRTVEKCTDAAEARERAYEESLKEDLTAEWVMPIGFYCEQSLRVDKIEGVASVDKSITPENRGYQMLMRMGWKGGGLGPKQNGIAEPVRGGLDRWDRAGGIGRQEQDEHYTNEENIERKKLATEVEETEEDRVKRETLLEKETRIKEAVQEMVDVFKCQLCNKQYKNVMEFEQHLSSYDHHHKKRLIEMKDNMKGTHFRADILKRDQRQSEKEMEKFNKLFEAKQASAQGGATAVTPIAPAPTTLPSGEGRAAIKMGFGGKKQKGGTKTKIKQAVAAFQLDSDDDATS
mmetsp:Transcript_33361/g.55985  ORF Transcript_33361/g.55985 Transcript_33361/m.55985 type:complete len:301 (-) Transcript_33361:121-1023(-)|eukprot:CAMPEP_0198224892 /NCGR_PEP_ID=MMETSP1445-20131203/98731_1 /TAXON_ID=36898 /ORGANISM="Pyramimonas sp., Strain CCMP2087" /LENGTH=300 /DNA_ID=CAMNT_0043904209 /DNA_START=334 /DNA_END=1236 /DNA_ORIENTATION=-